MCLIAFAYGVHPEYPLVVAANRDEFHARPTAQAAFWDEQPGILAGRDLECMGTWMGVTRSGRFAAVTNYRDPDDVRDNAESRGTLVSSFLEQSTGCDAFLDKIAAKADAYRGFNLLVSDGAEMFYYTNRSGEPRRLTPGIYGLSNHLLDTPWPKVTKARTRLELALAPRPAIEPLFALMADTALADDSDLPRTGVGAERERMLSAARIVSAAYGTRSSTVLLQGRDGNLHYAERSYNADGGELDTVRYELRSTAWRTLRID